MNNPEAKESTEPGDHPRRELSRFPPPPNPLIDIDLNDHEEDEAEKGLMGQYTSATSDGEFDELGGRVGNNMEYAQKKKLLSRDRPFSFYNRRSMREPEPPIDDATFIDKVLSCGAGSKSYTLTYRFASAKFRAQFATKIYCVLLVQLLLILGWTYAVLVTPNLHRIQEVEYSTMIVGGGIIYLIVYVTVRFTRCGGDGMCFLGYLMLNIMMTCCLASISGGLAILIPSWIYAVVALLCTYMCLVVTNHFKLCNITTRPAFYVALLAGATNSCLMFGLFLKNNWDGDDLDSECLVCYNVKVAVSIFLFPPLCALYIVYEVKKLLGGRRTHLSEHEWMLAAMVL